MKVLGITAGRKGGNSEIMLKTALEECERLGAEVIIGYIIFMGFYLGITYIVWSLRHRNARRTRKIYEENIRKIDKIYQREDRENR